jgi:hypothetical protein
MKKLGLFFVCGIVAVFLIAGVAAAKDRVVIYTSLENEEIVEYLKVACRKRQPAGRLHLGLGGNQHVGIRSQGHAGNL